MESNLPPGCPTLPDGLVPTAALVGLEDNRFSSMFLNGIQSMLCLWGLLHIYPNAVPVEESINCCKNCALKLHLYITCAGCHFGKWFLDAAGGGGVQNQCSHSMVSRNLISTKISPHHLWNCAPTANPASLWAWMPFLFTVAATTLGANASSSSAAVTTLDK